MGRVICGQISSFYHSTQGLGGMEEGDAWLPVRFAKHTLGLWYQEILLFDLLYSIPFAHM